MTRQVVYVRRDPAGSWASEAACKGSRVHFPDSPQGTFFYKQAVEQAKSMCAMCPVRDPCLDLAIANREKEGIWGGHVFPVGTRIRKQRLAVTVEAC